MARLGAFDATLEPRAWFDSKALPEGWFSDELIPAPASGAYTLVVNGATYSYSGNDANFLYSRVLAVGGGVYNYSGNNATLTYSGGPPPIVEVIGVGGPQVTNIFLFNGVTEPPFPVQRRTS